MWIESYYDFAKVCYCPLSYRDRKRQDAVEAWNRRADNEDIQGIKENEK